VSDLSDEDLIRRVEGALVGTATVIGTSVIAAALCKDYECRSPEGRAYIVQNSIQLALDLMGALSNFQKEVSDAPASY
jgi:hypothetical protein